MNQNFQVGDSVKLKYDVLNTKEDEFGHSFIAGEVGEVKSITSYGDVYNYRVRFKDSGKLYKGKYLPRMLSLTSFSFEKVLLETGANNE